FEDNVLRRSPDTNLSCRGAGLNIQVTGGNAVIRDTTFLRNFASGQVTVGGGLHAMVQGVNGTGLTVEDSAFIGNLVPLDTGEGTGADVWVGDGNGAPAAVLRRLRFVTQSSGRTQLTVGAVRSARVDVSDSLIANGRGGVRAFANEGVAYFTNLTIAHNVR